jgi:hypothetical protein
MHFFYYFLTAELFLQRDSNHEGHSFLQIKFNHTRHQLGLYAMAQMNRTMIVPFLSTKHLSCTHFGTAFIR